MKLFHRKLFGGMCVTAAGIVFILLIIYVAIWDKQNLAGWTQFNIFVALFFVVLMEGMRTLLDSNALKVQSTPACVIIGNLNLNADMNYWLEFRLLKITITDHELLVIFYSCRCAILFLCFEHNLGTLCSVPIIYYKHLLRILSIQTFQV